MGLVALSIGGNIRAVRASLWEQRDFVFESWWQLEMKFERRSHWPGHSLSGAGQAVFRAAGVEATAASVPWTNEIIYLALMLLCIPVVALDLAGEKRMA
eukprot:1160918-Pelagomonas_calceolata.AAC.6